MRKRKKKKLNFSDKAMIVLAVLEIVFISAVLVFVWFERNVPDALIWAVLGGGSFEAGCLARIYVAKKQSDAENCGKDKGENQ